ncbi:MAG: hypothetical protein FWC34_07870 [Bacteroidetes bacterium]|nr:hypothetical protein [Bacteroidota bacterium]MCL2302605.1 hypothetical protein [Lentimicrobiaceae bacterium]
MNRKKTDKEEIISLAKKTKYYCDLLIEQSENWEEGEKQKTEKQKSLTIKKYSL